MTMKELEKNILNIIEEYAEIEEIDTDTSLTKDIGFSSMQVMAIVADIEDEFDIDIKPSSLTTIKTFGDLVAFVAAQLD